MKFAQFELLYGRTVRGPMSIVKELWTDKVPNSEIKTTYQYVLDLHERLEKTCEIAQEHLQKSADKHKHYYNAKARVRNNLLKKYIKRSDSEPQKHDDETAKPKAMNVLDCACVGIIECEQEHEMHEPDAETKVDNEDVITLPSLKAKEIVDDVQISADLNEDQTKQAKQLLGNFREVMTDLPGQTSLAQHDIKISSTEPIRSKPYPLPYALRDTVNKEVDDMLHMGIIEISDSPYASPIVLVKKRDGSNQFCVDFRKLNKVTVFDAEPIPSQEQIFAKLANDHFFTKLDLRKGYWQIPVKPEARDKTAFVSPNGLYQFRMMPFGLVNAPATFSRMMRTLLNGLSHVDNYIDDILVHTETWVTHMYKYYQNCCENLKTQI